MNDFFMLKATEQAALIKKASDQLSMPEIIIEKDIWICWLLERIFSLPIRAAFKGGTSLSKVFKLIKRFSEDCDITIDYNNFKPELDLENISRSRVKKISVELKDQLKAYISEVVLPLLQNEINNSFPIGFFNITLSDDGEQLRFYYPSVVNTALLNTKNGASILTETDGYLKDHVLIEFGVKNSTEPCEKYPLATYLSEVIALDLGLPKPVVNTLSPIRTFFEKATLIHVECHRDRTKQSIDRLSRHWYDLYILHNSWVGREALLRFEVLCSVIEHKKSFFYYSFANYDDCLSGKFRLVPGQSYLADLEKDYTRMISSGMFNESPPNFQSILTSLSKLEQEINDGVKTYFKKSI